MNTTHSARWITAGTAFAVLVPLAGAALGQIITTDVNFPRGRTSTIVKGTIAGDQTRDYVVRAGAGQVMKVTLSGSSIVYFNVLAPGSNDEAIFIGSTEGNNFGGTLSVSGAYKVRVYQMRATARRGERGSFSLDISVTGSSSGGQAGAPGGGSGGGSGSGLSGIAGMNAVKAIDEMTNRGFTNVDYFQTGNTQYGIYYNRSTRTCAQLTMADGKVLDAKDIRTHEKCR
jgi:hypothetical protein